MRSGMSVWWPTGHWRGSSRIWRGKFPEQWRYCWCYLLAGILTDEDGLGGYRFDDYHSSFRVGNVALAVILLDGGLRTTFATFRTGLKPATLLAATD